MKVAKNARNRALLICLLIMLFPATLPAQNQQVADSLKIMLETRQDLTDSLQASLLFRIVLASSAPEDILLYADKLQQRAEQSDLPNYQVNAFIHRGIAYRFMGDMERALENLFRGASLAVEKSLPASAAEAYMEIATTYTAAKDIKTAVSYEHRGIEIMRQYAKPEQLAIGLLNIGFSYYTLQQYDSALAYYREAEPLFRKLSLDIGTAYLTGNRALVYWKKGDLASAEAGLDSALQMLEPLGDTYGMADFHNQLGNLYLDEEQPEKAVTNARKAYALALTQGLKEQLRDATQILATLYRNTGDFEQAYHFRTLHQAYKDSVENAEQIREIAGLRTRFEVNLREKEITLLENQQQLKNIYILVAVILLLLSVVFILYMVQRNKNARLLAAAERKKHSQEVKELLVTQENKALESMVQGRDTERRRLAHELHNHFGSLLATIKVNINALEAAQVSNHGTLTTLVDQACADMRSISHRMNMGVSGDFGLVPALKELVSHLREASQLHVEFSASTYPGNLESETEITIYRVVQELVSNILKHAEATQISILLTCYTEEKQVNIMVQDNGRGFSVAQAQKKAGGMGLGSLVAMVESRNGDIHFDSNPASGTTVTVDLPFTVNSEDF